MPEALYSMPQKQTISSIKKFHEGGLTLNAMDDFYCAMCTDILSDSDCRCLAANQMGFNNTNTVSGSVLREFVLHRY